MTQKQREVIGNRGKGPLLNEHQILVDEIGAQLLFL